MRIFLFAFSIVSLLLAAHQFSRAEQTGQFKGALSLLLIGIQLLIASTLIYQHREERTKKSSASTDKGDNREAGLSGANTSDEQRTKS